MLLKLQSFPAMFCQVSPVAFHFTDMTSAKGLSEEMVGPSGFLFTGSLSLPCQLEIELNCKFLFSWLPLFATDPPTALECKAC